jgi:mannose-6-phosphate isomerase-like protein (cupin superfamily)/SAM-dependent methyltransferase
MTYTYSIPKLPSFEGKGLFGYTFGPLQQKDLEIYYIDVDGGHDTFMVSKKITRTYYVLCGNGYFTIGGRQYDVSPDMLVEVPPEVEYSYSGKMKLICISKPRWFTGNDTHTRRNPDVVQEDFPRAENDSSLLTQLLKMKIFGKSPTSAFLRLNRRLWTKLPASFNTFSPVRSYGDLVHTLARVQGVRAQAPSTFFLRNRPQLELIQRLAARSAKSGALRVAVLGCSTGAEAFSIAWAIRSAKPELKLILHAVDISRWAVEVAKRGAYSTDGNSLDTNILERMTETEIDELFDRDRDVVSVKSWIKEGIQWHVGNAAESQILEALGPQDIAVANNFLCHMHPVTAERCLRNIAGLVRPDGYLFVSGVDLDVRTRVANELGWKPLRELLEEIHDGDPCMKPFWPWHYGGLEPLNKKRPDWQRRYAAAFQLVSCGENAQDPEGVSMAAENVLGGARSNSVFYSNRLF